MSDTEDDKETAMLQESEVVEFHCNSLRQTQATETTKSPLTPIGEKYMRTDESYDSKD